MVQDELFREDSHLGSATSPRKAFLSKYQLTLGLDKILLVLITMIFAFTLSHSFGVERGKRLMEKKFESLIPSQTQTVPQEDPMNDPYEVIESEIVSDQPLLLPNANRPLKPVDKTLPNSVMPSKGEIKKMGNFTVQLVTYDNPSLAEKEISRLKSRGYEGFIIPSGSYYQVCANYFETKSKARSDLEALKQTGRYPDAYIRPVIR